MFGSFWLDDNFNSLMCYEITRYLEDRGYEAVPIFPNPTEAKGMGVSVSEGRPAPNVTPDFQYAVVACGLGEMVIVEILTLTWSKTKMINENMMQKLKTQSWNNICTL